MAILEKFAGSLKPGAASKESITHPYRVYELLCRAARICIDFSTSALSTNSEQISHGSQQLDSIDKMGFLPDVNEYDGQTEGLTDWYYSNLQMMNFLDDNTLFQMQ